MVADCKGTTCFCFYQINAEKFLSKHLVVSPCGLQRYNLFFIPPNFSKKSWKIFFETNITFQMTALAIRSSYKKNVAHSIATSLGKDASFRHPVCKGRTCFWIDQIFRKNIFNAKLRIHTIHLLIKLLQLQKKLALFSPCFSQFNSWWSIEWSLDGLLNDLVIVYWMKEDNLSATKASDLATKYGVAIPTQSSKA